MENLTIEQAFNNIQTAIEMFKGTKQEHIILEQSIDRIKSLMPLNKVKSMKSEDIFDAKVTEIESN